MPDLGRKAFAFIGGRVFNRCFGAAMAAFFLTLSLPRHAWNRLRTRKSHTVGGDRAGLRLLASMDAQGARTIPANTAPIPTTANAPIESDG